MTIGRIQHINTFKSNICYHVVCYYLSHITYCRATYHEPFARFFLRPFNLIEAINPSALSITHPYSERYLRHFPSFGLVYIWECEHNLVIRYYGK
jgi:hypothetical protein